MHPRGFTEKEGEKEDTAEYGHLRGLKITKTQIKPAARTKDFHSDKKNKDEQDNADDIDWYRSVSNPSVVIEGDDKIDG
jgi:hypothetical protein